MKFYIAGASREIERAKRAIALVRSLGHEVTHDWTVEVEDSRARGLSDRTYSAAERRRFAAADYNGVVNADVVWVLAPSGEWSRGCWVELGIALGHDSARVIVSGDHAQTIFSDLADETYDRDEDVGF